ncbi:hypothetical protein ACTI_83050 [Actinoplanes sp. OR16]|uniref:nucleotidyl transferase AbiEii/AbiGii toxin family protein n=1 Tax=Actinoplanes sp. OR16 TaxID=946334 RepID=UPI000F6F76BB|nr:nucleotidyl transferase AbiEii/AbiGii toxin family protein [Actinoplanes sp. OR16]BBH71620.1 hypothetical protein ACTI_83050 [Actinoplanes sp. OR16]
MTPPRYYDERREHGMRRARAGKRGYPDTYLPLARERGVRQLGAFDPALKQYDNAYRAGEPVFQDPETGRRWTEARRAALRHVLAVIAGTRSAGHLVLRGSAAMQAWVGDAARDPGDLDFVVTPATITSDSVAARNLLADITAGLHATPGAGLRPEDTAESAIWTYERADGRRLVIPFGAAGHPDGTVQVDVVFGEELPIPPEPITVLGLQTPILAATAGLSLAWKLMWLATDMYPQGKDLYDAVLLAEHTTVDLTLVRNLLRPELGTEADDFGPESVLGWTYVDWRNFTDEYPGTEGTSAQWLSRLSSALTRP